MPAMDEERFKEMEKERFERFEQYAVVASDVDDELPPRECAGQRGKVPHQPLVDRGKIVVILEHPLARDYRA